MLRVTVCVSGGGTNLQAIIDRIQDGTIRNAQIVQVISNNAGAYALERAARAGIPGVCVSPKDYPDREAFNEALLAKINEVSPDLIVLAGFMVAVPKQICAAYAGKIINIHPALIPSFCGPGYYGLHVHEQALRYGVKLSGATVHFVSAECDGGPIIAQKSVEVRPDDTPEVLQKRIMEQAEWILLPQAVKAFCEDRITVEGRTVIIG